MSLEVSERLIIAAKGDSFQIAGGDILKCEERKKSSKTFLENCHSIK